jgi:peptidoglycan-associated lipoprotein
MRRQASALWRTLAAALILAALGGCATGPASPVGASGTGPASVAGGTGVSAATGTAAAAGSAESTGVRAPGATLFPALPSPKDFAAIPELRDVYFDFDRATLRPEDERVVDANARWLRAHPATVVLVEGHADERGTNEYNLALGESRARAARDQLVARGVAPSRVTIVSYGEERPVCHEAREACWARNRRAHFLVGSVVATTTPRR